MNHLGDDQPRLCIVVNRKSSLGIVFLFAQAFVWRAAEVAAVAGVLCITAGALRFACEDEAHLQVRRRSIDQKVRAIDIELSRMALELNLYRLETSQA
jgi:hypothetical protein